MTTELGIQREPIQGRSRASLNRMLNAAEKLLSEAGSDEFTLADVSKVGKVSIGSIYNRFGSKDELLYAVHAKVLAKIDKDMNAALAEASESATDLYSHVALLIEAMSEVLRKYASVLRPFMMRSLRDSTIAQAGKTSYEATEKEVVASFEPYRADIAYDDTDKAVTASYRIVYAAIARYLGFGSESLGLGSGGWKTLKADLGVMWAAYLTYHPESPKRPK